MRVPLPSVDIPGRSVANGIDFSSAMAQMVPDVSTVRNFCDLIAAPALGAIIPDSIKDVRSASQTVTLRSDALQVGSFGQQLRGLVFVNYSPSVLYVHIFGSNGVIPASAIPDFPPIPVQQNQTFILDASLLGVDGFGYTACTIRVSTTAYNYNPTAVTPGLWQAVVRTKAAT